MRMGSPAGVSEEGQREAGLVSVTRSVVKDSCDRPLDGERVSLLICLLSLCLHDLALSIFLCDSGRQGWACGLP